MAVLQRLNQERHITVIMITRESDIARFIRRVLHLRDGQISADEIIPESERLTARSIHEAAA